MKITVDVISSEIVITLDATELPIVQRAKGLQQVLDQWLSEQRSSLSDIDRQAIAVALNKADAATITSVKTVLGV